MASPHQHQPAETLPLLVPQTRPYFTHSLWRGGFAAAAVPLVMATPPDVQRTLGVAVKEIRTAPESLTQEELSGRTGVHPTYISDVEARVPATPAGRRS